MCWQIQKQILFFFKNLSHIIFFLHVTSPTSSWVRQQKAISLVFENKIHASCQKTFHAKLNRGDNWFVNADFDILPNIAVTHWFCQKGFFCVFGGGDTSSGDDGVGGAGSEWSQGGLEGKRVGEGIS